MPNDFSLGSEDANDFELTDELRGTIVEVEDTSKRLYWGIGIGTVCVLLLAFSWSTFFLSRTEEEIYREKLADRRMIHGILQDVTRAVYLPTVTTKDLLEAMRSGLDVAQTEMRADAGVGAPYIEERDKAIVAVLEGLLRLRLEGRLDETNSAQMATYRGILEQLGILELEYYEGGIVERIPILETAKLQQQMRHAREKSDTPFGEIDDLKARLVDVQKKESFSVMSAAHLVGRWFRYQNKQELAEQCFHIARRYVEGYALMGINIPGKRPKEIGPDWAAYAGALEALAELSFQNSNYRIARSYLSRMFETPNPHLATKTKYELTHARPWDQRAEQGLRHDLATIERAIEAPASLRSYPYFDEHDLASADVIAEVLISSAPLSNSPPAKKVWELLDPELRERLYNKGLRSRLSLDLKQDLLDSLNRLLVKPHLEERLGVEVAELPARAQNWLKQVTEGTLPEEMHASLNREILNTALGEGSESPFTLSNGTHLTNVLGHRAKGVLIGLYEQELVEGDVGPTRREWLSDQIEGLLKGTVQVTVQDFNSFLAERRVNVENQLLVLTAELNQTNTDLEALRGRIRQLESSSQLDLRGIRKLQQEELALKGHLDEIRRHRDQEVIRKEELAVTQEALTADLEHRAQGLRRQLSLYEGKADFTKSMEREEPLLVQIDHQISLREQYLDLLTKLKEAGGDQQIRRMRIERVRIEKEIEVLKKQISGTSGDEREDLEKTLVQLEDRRTGLVQQFEGLFAPIRDIVAAVAEKEQEIWRAEKILRQTREELVRILGSDKVKGSLQSKTERRQRLLEMKGPDLARSQNYREEINELNRLISEDHAKIQMLLQREQEAKETLKLFYPHIVRNHPLIQGGELESLVDYLSRQGSLMQHYSNLTAQGEVLREIHTLERGLVENLRRMADLFGDDHGFSEEQTTRLTRVMQEILVARKELRHRHQILKQVAERTALHASRHDISARGYLLDSVELFQMEQKLGLNLTEARRLFEERQQLIDTLRDINSRKEELEAEKLAAIQERAQEKIDAILPRIADLEMEIRRLSDQVFGLQEGLRNLATAYQRNLPKVQEYRKSIYPEIDEIHQRLLKVNQEMAKNDTDLSDVVSQLFQTADRIGQTLTSLDEDDLKNIDALITGQKMELDRLTEVRSLKARENYYKAKALYLMGLSYYEQSRLPDYETLVDSNSINPQILRDQERNTSLIFEEYDESNVYTPDFLTDSRGADEHQAGYQMWVQALENQALSIFQIHIPRYAPSYTDDRGDISRAMSQDFDLFLARARFLTGKTHMNRAIRQIRSSSLKPADNQLARKELDIAGNALLSYLDYTGPLRYQAQGTGQLSESRFGSPEFPHRARQPVEHDDEARILLGAINTLKGNYLEAISYYRDLLSHLTLQADSSEQLQRQIDPMITEPFHYTTGVHPYYASLLARHPLAHEALYRLGRNYQLLSEEQQKLAKEFVPPPFDQLELLKNRAQEYAQRSVGYYSQLILTKAYSSFRRPAQLQRGLLRKALGDYHGARQDLVTVLGSPTNTGGSFDITAINSKGDLPGELNPGYVQVAFELGKLHLENGNFAGAVEAFHKAQETELESDFVIKSKIAYADTLIQSKQWGMAHILLSELVEARKQSPERRRHLYPIDLYISLARVSVKMGNQGAALQHLQEVFQLAPRELVDEFGLNLNNSYGLTLLETDYRDSIRPLAEASMLYGSIMQRRRDYPMATRYFTFGEKLWGMVPWQEDRALRDLSRDEYLAHKQESLVQARWEQRKTLALELLYATYLPYRNAFPTGVDNPAVQLNPNAIVERIDSALAQTSELQESHQEVLEQLREFYRAESAQLPETIEKRRVAARREQDRLRGGQKILRYETLAKLRKTLMQLPPSEEPTLQQLANRFSRDSLEEHLLKQFVLLYAGQLQLTQEDRKAMHPENNNVQNLLVIDNAPERLADFPFKMQEWLEEQMRLTGLDDLFIPVSPIARILEETHLYLASILSIHDSGEEYRELAELSENYILETDKEPNRISSAETVWRLIEIAAMTADAQRDWDRSHTFHSFLLRPDQQRYFAGGDNAGRYRAELALARSMLELGQQVYEDAVFVQNPVEQSQLEAKGSNYLRRGREILNRLKGVKGDDAGAVSARIQAKWMLQQAGT